MRMNRPLYLQARTAANLRVAKDSNQKQAHRCDKLFHDGGHLRESGSTAEPPPNRGELEGLTRAVATCALVKETFTSMSQHARLI
jgi:hypothetical protein